MKTLNNFDQHAQKVWAEKNVEAKRVMVIDMVKHYKAKDQQAKHLAQVESMDGPKLDKFAADLALRGTGHQVVRI